MTAEHEPVTYSVIAHDDEEHPFTYNEEEWSKLCENVGHFASFQEYATTKVSDVFGKEPIRSIRLPPDIDAKTYRIVENYLTQWTFGCSVTADNFLHVIKVVDYLQVEHADTDLADAIDDGAIFYPNVKTSPGSIWSCGWTEMDNCFLVCTHALFDYDMHPLQFPCVKRALADLCLYLNERRDLCLHIPKGLVSYLLTSQCRRKFGLERDVFRVALIRCEGEDADLEDLLRLIRDVRFDWPRGRVLPWLFGDATRMKINEARDRLAGKWLTEERRRCSFVASVVEDFCLDAAGWTDVDRGVVRNADFDAVYESLSDLIIRGLINEEFLKHRMFENESKMLEKPRHERSKLFAHGSSGYLHGCFKGYLHEYHPYFKKQLRLLAVPPEPLFFSRQEDFPKSYYLLPVGSRGVWMIAREPFYFLADEMYEEVATTDSNWKAWGHRTDSFFFSWFIDFDTDLEITDNDVFEHYVWRPMPNCTLPREENQLPYTDSMTVVKSNGGSTPLVLVGYFPRQSETFTWKGYFMEHAHIGGSFDLVTNDEFVIFDELPEYHKDVYACHHDVDETRTRVYFFRGKRYHSSVYFAVYLVDKTEQAERSYVPIFSNHLLQYDVSLEKVFNTCSTTNNMLQYGEIHLSCTNSGRPFVLKRAYHYVNYASSIKNTPFNIVLDCALLRETGVWEEFTASRLNPEMKIGDDQDPLLERSSYSVENVNVTANSAAGNYMFISSGYFRDYIFVDLESKNVITEPCFVSFDGNGNVSDIVIKMTWKNHVPFMDTTKDIFSNLTCIAHRAFIPSSRDGFWSHLKRGQRDDGDPYDMINWKWIKKEGLL